MSDDVFIFVIVGGIALASAAFCPGWYRKQAEKARPRLVEKHGEYVSRVHSQFGDLQALTEEESWDLIREAVTLKSRVSIALFSIFAMSVPIVYPLYAEAVSGPNIPYWKELLLGVSLGLAFATIFRFCGNVAFRFRIRQLVDSSK